MVDRERVARLIGQIRDSIGALEQLAATPVRDLRSDPLTLDAAKYRFVIAIEGCVRLAHHLVASEGWAPPDTNAGAVVELGQHAVIDASLAERVARAVGFRNVLVHQYVNVDDDHVV